MNQPNPFSLTAKIDPQKTSNEREVVTQRCTWISIVVNLVLSIVQLLAGILSSSQGLIADAIHSLSDLLSDFVVLLANHHSRKEADSNHHYGHQRYENAASLILGLLLLMVGIGMAWAAVQKLQSPGSIPAVHMAALWVCICALATKEFLFRYMLALAERVRSSMLVANAWHARSDAFSSLVVAIGIAGNLMGVPILDPIAALVVGLMISRIGCSFAWTALHDLTDRAATEEQVAGIAADILSTHGVQGLHELKTRKTGDMILADVHLEVDGQITVAQGHEIAKQATLKVMARHPVLYLTTHVDPVVPR